MECAVITDAFCPLEPSSRPVPEVHEEGLVLKTLYAGICHSDLHFLDDEMDLGNGKVYRNRDLMGDKYKGVILGHEICGQVIAKGSKVPSSCSIKLGDPVVVFPWIGCGACEDCSTGSSNLCSNNPAGMHDIGQNGKQGGFSTHVSLPDWTMAIKLPKNIPPEIGCMLPCSVVTSYHALVKAKPALDNATRTRGVANLLVIGAGGLGFWTVILVKYLLCDKNVKIIVADTSEEKLTEISNVGADDAVLWPEDRSVRELVTETTVSGYNQIDAAIDYVGLARTSEIAISCLQCGGALVLVGLRGGLLSVPIPVVIGNNLSIHGIRTAPRAMVQDLVDLFAVQGVEKRPPLEYFSLKDINEAMDKLRSAKVKGRALLKFTE